MDTTRLLTDTAQLDLTDALTRKTVTETKIGNQTIKVQRLLMLMVLGVIGSGLAYLIGLVFMVRKMYPLAIQQIDDARSKKLYDGPSGLRTAFAFHLGKLGSFLAGFESPAIPSALIVMCYEKNWQDVFSEQGIENWFACIYKIGSENSHLGPEQIFCMALNCSRGPEYGCPKSSICPNVIPCLPLCNPTKYIQTDTTSMIAMDGVNAAVSGATAFAAFGSIVPGVGTAIGAVIGAIFGGALGTAAAIEQSKAIHAQCVSMRKNCVMPPNAPACGGFD